MIKTLELHNWKAYAHRRISFESGATFIVAKNGVGKSSIVQGIHFALFGGETLAGRPDSPVTNAIRGADGTEGYAQLKLRLGNHDVDVRRSVVKQRRVIVQSAIQIDGSLASEADLRRLIHQETGVDPTQLSMLSVVSEGQVLSAADAGVDIASMLSETFGVDRLRSQATLSKKRAGQLDREADSLRRNLRDVPANRDDDQLAELRALLTRLQRDRDQQREQLSAERSQQVAWEQWATYEAATTRFAESQSREEHETARMLASWQARLTDIVGHKQDDRRTVDALLESMETAISANTRVRAKEEAGVEAAQAALEKLSSGGAVCPTCRRPLTGQELAEARSDNEALLTAHQSAVREIDSQLRALGLLRGDLIAWRRRPSPARPLRPDVPQPGPGDPSQRISELEVALDRCNLELGNIQAQLRQIEASRHARAENEALGITLFDMYRRAEMGYALSDTLSTAADTICAERITPLTQEVQKRWASLWRREPIQMDSTGALSLDASEGDIPFSEFSGGQRTIAQVLVRILALQMATRSPFLVLDEPLEHLDPRNRRLLASLLVRACEGGTPLRQVLVTTYEESVTRRLATWGGDPGEGAGPFRSRVVQIAPTTEE